MKRFTRSIAGKTTLFIAFTICLCITVTCAVSAVVMWDTGFYTHEESELLREYRYNEIHSMVYSFAYNTLINQNDYDPGFDHAIVIRDSDGQVVLKTDSATDAMSRTDYDQYNFEIGLRQMDDETELLYMGSDSLWSDENITYYTITVYDDPSVSFNQQDALLEQVIYIACELRYAIYPIGLVVLIGAVSIFITLICVAGKRPGTEELFPGPFFQVPYDLMLVAAIFCGAFAIVLVVDACSDVQIVFGVLACILAVIPLFLGLCMSLASRVKQKVLWRNTVIYKCFSILFRILRRIWCEIKRAAKWFGSVYHNLPMVWRTALILFGLSLLEFIVIMSFWYEMDNLFIFWFIEKLLLIPVILFVVITMRKLQQAGQDIAAGDLSHQMDTKGLFWDFKRHGENLNSISVGMSQAVEQRLKSERLKTELITNVSHDIKTPLTSIINYAGLIGNEKSENQNITEYSEVLVRQSERLKRLIEDLVEASKASTGNLEVTPVPCSASVFLAQAGGEYEEKLKEAGLQLVTKLPEQELRIMADSRKMWRVFDNLMNNIYKYAQSGTRVYLSLEEIGQQVVITFKNTSRDPLDISADELMERFVRSDASRNTEGNGLGLSIARSLIELQGGTLAIEIDGDLFKVMLVFSTI